MIAYVLSWTIYNIIRFYHSIWQGSAQSLASASFDHLTVAKLRENFPEKGGKLVTSQGFFVVNIEYNSQPMVRGQGRSCRKNKGGDDD